MLQQNFFLSADYNSQNGTVEMEIQFFANGTVACDELNPLPVILFFWYWDIREDIRAAKNATFGKVYTGVLHGIERDVVYKARVFAYSYGGDGKKSGDVFFTLGGRVQYNPSTTELLNNSPVLHWSNKWTTVIFALPRSSSSVPIVTEMIFRANSHGDHLPYQ
ncbi:hypothetical protein Btru_058049 [Bulinus truncatus]|nr:hypothetical protein Btru_058049 [Bulinus truncatus]